MARCRALKPPPKPRRPGCDPGPPVCAAKAPDHVRGGVALATGAGTTWQGVAGKDRPLSLQHPAAPAALPAPTLPRLCPRRGNPHAFVDGCGADAGRSFPKPRSPRHHAPGPPTGHAVCEAQVCHMPLPAKRDGAPLSPAENPAGAVGAACAHRLDFLPDHR